MNELNIGFSLHRDPDGDCGRGAYLPGTLREGVEENSRNRRLSPQGPIQEPV